MGYILRLIILFFACGIAMVLLKRLQDTQQRLLDLGKQLERNAKQMAAHRTRMEHLAAEKAAENNDGEIKLEGPSDPGPV